MRNYGNNITESLLITNLSRIHWSLNESSAVTTVSVTNWSLIYYLIVMPHIYAKLDGQSFYLMKSLKAFLRYKSLKLKRGYVHTSFKPFFYFFSSFSNIYDPLKSFFMLKISHILRFIQKKYALFLG